jgi:hypothetical protein
MAVWTFNRQPVRALDVKVVGVKERGDRFLMKQAMFKLEVVNDAFPDNVELCA